MTAALFAQKIKFRQILTDISHDFAPGRLVGLIGPNGAGKTTFLRVVAGVLQPESGQVLLGEQTVHQLPPKQRAKHIAYMPQTIGDQIPFTVQQFVEMGRYAYREGMFPDPNEGAASIAEALRITRMTELAGSVMSRLSGGERQRAMVARCLAQDARILLLDEPISNLDLYFQIELLELLADLAKQGYLILLAIHHLELAARYCDELVVLRKGEIYRSGTPTEVLTTETMRDVFRLDSVLFRDPVSNALRISL